MLSSIRTLWYTSSICFTAAKRSNILNRCPISRRAIVAGSCSHAIPMAQSVVCPVTSAPLPAPSIASACKRPRKHGRWYPEYFRINFSRCIFCGFCEEACPTYAIQLTPDFEMSEYDRQNLVYEKEDLLISGTGKYPGYSFYNVSGLAIPGKDKGEAERERPPIDSTHLLP